VSSRRGETLFAAGIVTLFFLVRLALLVVREPFFDELYTVWMARRPLGDILPALLHDSGPPLYYFLARIPNVMALRVLSLLFATATLALILTRRSLGEGRYIAALLLALYPPAVLFAVDARAYALCGLFVTIGAIATHEKRPNVATAAFLLAAYSHWYGALFLLLVARFGWRRLAAASLLFAPGLYLASRQPPEAIQWFVELNAFAPLGVLFFTGHSVEALLAVAPTLILVISALALIAAGARSSQFLPLVAVPVLLAIAFSIAGRPVYFPMRFESVLAVPLVLWLATSLAAWTPRVRIAITAVLCLCGAVAIWIGVLDHARRPLDPYRQAALVLQQATKPDQRVLASGFLYLEAAHQLGAERVQAFPAEQGRHPGWRLMQRSNEELPKGELIWIGERGAPELAALRGRPMRVVFANDRALIVHVRP
jgi:hypothetical protein